METRTDESLLYMGLGRGAGEICGGASYSGLGDQAMTMAVRKLGGGGVMFWGEGKASERGSVE
jgi:hypothetical protein